MRCPKCQYRNPEDTLYCGKCGSRLPVPEKISISSTETLLEGDTALSIALKHKTGIPKNPKEINMQIPEDLSRLILKCLEKDKEKRYQEPEEVLAELDKIEKAIPATEKIFPAKKVRTEQFGVEKKKRIIKYAATAMFLMVIILGGLFFIGRKEKAIEIDPSYALGYVGLADSYALLACYCYLFPKEATPKAQAAALKALEIDETLGEAHTSLAFIKRYYKFDWEGAEKEYQRGMDLLFFAPIRPGDRAVPENNRYGPEFCYGTFAAWQNLSPDRRIQTGY